MTKSKPDIHVGDLFVLTMCEPYQKSVQSLSEIPNSSQFYVPSSCSSNSSNFWVSIYVPLPIALTGLLCFQAFPAAAAALGRHEDWYMTDEEAREISPLYDNLS